MMATHYGIGVCTSVLTSWSGVSRTPRTVLAKLRPILNGIEVSVLKMSIIRSLYPGGKESRLIKYAHHLIPLSEASQLRRSVVS